jgi:hypothetical protein
MPFFQDDGAGSPNFARGGTQWSTGNHTIFGTDEAYTAYLASIADTLSRPETYKVFVRKIEPGVSSIPGPFYTQALWFTSPDNYVDLDSIHSAGLITVPRTGSYEFGVSLEVTKDNTTTIGRYSIVWGGTSTSSGFLLDITMPASTNKSIVSNSKVVSLVAGEQFSTYALFDSAGYAIRDVSYWFKPF